MMEVLLPLQQELRDQESQLKKLTGELSASSSGDATLKERQKNERFFKEMRKREF